METLLKQRGKSLRPKPFLTKNECFLRKPVGSPIGNSPDMRNFPLT